MLIKEYTNARTFLDDYETLLLEHETASQLVYYIARRLSQTQEEDNTVFGAVMEQQDTFLLFCNLMPHNLVIYTVKPENASTAAGTLADHLGNNRIKVGGVIAELVICQSFIENYIKHISGSFQEIAGIDIMELRSLNEIKPVEGFYRLALPEDVKLVTEWMIEFQMEALTSEMDYEAALQKAETQIREEKIHFYEDNEHHIVSMAIAARKLAHGTTITYIYTPEKYRGKGYAPANIFYLSKELLEQGNEFCSLFVDKKNPLSARAYEKIGYQIIGECYEYKAL
jgi:predicted GNAT family acetyltransferase